MAKGPSHSGFEPRTRDPERRDFFDLRRRIAALENGSGGGGSGAEEVFIGPSDPGLPYELWYDTDAPSPSGAIVESNSWTPTYTSFVPGSGATNNGFYIWIGGPNVGDRGILWLEINVTLGTGFTAWTAGHRFLTPPGFNWTPVSHGELGPASFIDASPGESYYGRCSVIGADRCSVQYFGTASASSGAAIRGITLSASLPFVWATGDRYAFGMCARGVRV